MDEHAPYHCTREGCERSFATEHGLTVHLARGHANDDTRDEHAALDRAEQQPVEDDTAEEAEETHDSDETVDEREMLITLDGDEPELLAAVCFVYDVTEAQIAAEAMEMYFTWARSDELTQQAVAVRRARAAAAEAAASA